MPDPWATSKRPSTNEGQTATSAPPETNRCGSVNCVPANKGTFALTRGFRGARPQSATRNVETRNMFDEALDFYVKAIGRDGTQKRQELVNMRPGDMRRGLERWQARAKEVQRLQDKKGASVGPPQKSAEFQIEEEGGLRERVRAQGSLQRQRIGQTTCSPRSRQPSVNLKLGRESGLPTASNLGEALRSLFLIAVPSFAVQLLQRSQHDREGYCARSNQVTRLGHCAHGCERIVR